MSLGIQKLLLILPLLVFSTLGICQNSNPFELQRTAIKLTDDSRIQADSQKFGSNINPFELRPSAAVDSAQNITQKNSLFRWIKEKNIYRISDAEIKSLLFWSLLFLSFLLAIALNINRDITVKLYRSLINLNFLSLLFRESREDAKLIYNLLYGLYFIGLSIFLYLVIIHHYGIKAPVYLLYVTGFILALYFLRHLSLKMIGMIYGTHKETEHYLFSIVIFGCTLSIVLIPANFIICFVNPDLASKCMFLVSIIIVILFIYRQLREMLFSLNLWRNHLFHFFLYLCTFEIAPLVLLYVYLNRQGVF